jgi:hypothetical protein
MLGAAALFVAVFVLGFLLRRSGKPFSGVVLTVHKLISLVVLILLILTVYRINKAAPLAFAALVAVVLTGVFFVVAIVSGGFASTERPAPAIALALHRVTPFLTIACTAATFFLLK